MHPLRLRLLEALTEQNSASGLARKLSIPRQHVNYHLRELENAGLVEEVEKRVKGNCVERIVRAKARYYVVAPSTLGTLTPNPDDIRDHASSAYLVAAASRAIEEMGWLRAKADENGKKLATLTLESEVRFASPATRKAFADELATAFANLVAKYHDSESKDGRTFRLMSAVWPNVPPNSKEQS
jgi:DNA-binding transcriptional ArsR family regulator